MNPNLKYYHFLNEFVGYNYSLLGQIQLFPSAAEEWVISGSQPESDIRRNACTNFTDDQGVLFPARIALANNSGISTEVFVSINGLEVPILGDAIPNPSSCETRIPIILPVNTENALLQMIELSTGKVLQNILVQNHKYQEVVLDVSKSVSSVYGYRLLVNGVPLPMKKIVVVH